LTDGNLLCIIELQTKRERGVIMGWMCMEKPEDVKSYLTNEVLSWTKTDPIKYTVLDSAIVNFREYYAAVERLNTETNERMVFAAIIMISYHRTGPYSASEMCYKDMDETSMPYLFKCPVRILNLLTETDNENALKWRQACRDYHQKPSCTFGDEIELETPLNFTDGVTRSRFKVIRCGKKAKRFKCLETGAIVQISQLKRRVYKIIS